MGRMGQLDVRSAFRALSGAALALAVASGCSAPAISERYAVNVGPRQVVLNCRDVYEVYDRADAETILVATSPGTEATVAVCGVPQTREERFRAVVQRFFQDTKRPPACRVIRADEMTPLHWEMHYRCA